MDSKTEREDIVIAFITYIQPYNGRLAAVVSADKAKEILRASEHPESLTEKQLAYMANIKNVYLAKPYPHTEPKQDDTVAGVLQGMSEQIPRGDR